MVTKPEFLVAKEKLLVALATISVAILSSVSQMLFCGETISGITKCHLFSQASCPLEKIFVIEVHKILTVILMKCFLLFFCLFL